MISHIIRAVAARLCSRYFYWKYQEGTREGCVPFPARLREGGGVKSWKDRQRAVFKVGSSLPGGRPGVDCGGGQCACGTCMHTYVHAMCICGMCVSVCVCAHA